MLFWGHSIDTIVERNLIVLVESARRLGDQAEILCPDIAWDNIRGIR